MADRQEQEQDAIQLLKAVFDGSDKWLFAVWSIEGGRLVMRRSFLNFPHGDWKIAVDLLKKEAVKELGLDTSPLPEATGFGIVGDDEDATTVTDISGVNPPVEVEDGISENSSVKFHSSTMEEQKDDVSDSAG